MGREWDTVTSMTSIRERIARAIPWVEPILDYFDWRKRLVALLAGVAIAGWSFVKDLPWPVIVTLGLATIVTVAYGSMFPAFVRLIHVGVNPRPNYSIWKHKKQFSVSQAAYLLADREPVPNPSSIEGDAAAWYAVLYEAIKLKDLQYIGASTDSRYMFDDGFHAQTFTEITADSLKKFCESKGRKPEFLNW